MLPCGSAFTCTLLALIPILTSQSAGSFFHLYSDIFEQGADGEELAQRHKDVLPHKIFKVSKHQEKN
jgi:hypothetical protein